LAVEKIVGFHEGGFIQFVMPSLVPGIHAFTKYQRGKDADGRDQPGNDEN
jgi:hypothetical protein